MGEFSKNIYTERMSRRERARIAGVQSVVGALTLQHAIERSWAEQAPLDTLPAAPQDSPEV